MLRRMEQARNGNRRGQRSRTEILEAASRVMAERGYAGTSMSVLASEAGLPKSAIYHHFRSKGGLLSAVMEQGAQDFFGTLESLHADPPLSRDHRERLGWFLQRTGEAFMAKPDFLRLHLLLVMSAEAAEAEVGEIIERVRREGRELMNRMIAASFADAGEEVAQAIADELDYFGIAGFDGSFVAQQADPKRTIPEQMALLTEAIALLGEARLERLER